MATFSIEVPDDQVELIVDSFAQQYNMDSSDEADLEAKVEFSRQQVMSYINDVVRGHLAWQHEQAKPEIPEVAVDLT
jgi:hypothetical protein